MSWLRIDDGFTRHPKITALTLRSRWIWLDLLCYSARYETDGWLPENIAELVPGADEKYLTKALELELLDDEETGLRIHDWRSYGPKDPTAAERQAKWRRKRNGQRNGTSNADVTENVTDTTVTPTVTETSTSRAGTARVPVPSPSTKTHPPLPVTRPDDRGGRPDLNQLGRTPDEQARIDAVDEFLEGNREPDQRDPYTDKHETLGPVGDEARELMTQLDAYHRREGT